jgi:uncharacterized protein
MKARQYIPRKMDIGAFIEEQSLLEGQIPVADLTRLAQSMAPEADLAAVPAVAWTAQGRLVPQRVGAPQTWLDLTATADLPWTCQRCLHPVFQPVSVLRSIRFVDDEAMAAQLDADLDDDVLSLSRSFDLLDLIEDELIMEAPLVPMHEQCPVALKMSVADPGVDAEEPVGAAEGGAGGKPNPFAVLAQLKKK